MPIIPYHNQGKTWYTHSCWLSVKQRNAYFSIPQQNNNLCYYYSISALALTAILHRKVSLIGGMYKALGVYTGAATVTAGTFLVCKLLMSQRTPSQINDVVSVNQSLYTPFWSDPGQVKKLSAKGSDFDRTILGMRLSGSWNNQQQMRRYNPDFILKHPNADEWQSKVKKLCDIMGFDLTDADKI